jgi:recombinational DNA repair protein RecT
MNNNINNVKKRVFEIMQRQQELFNATNERSGNYVSYDEEVKYFGKMICESKVVGSMTDNDIGQCFLKIAKYGLSCEQELGLLYLESRSKKMAVGYKGGKALIMREDDIAHFVVDLIHENDEFVGHRPDQPVEHRITSLSDKKRGNIDGGYAQTTFKNGSVLVLTMSAEEIEAHLTMDGGKNAIYNGPYYKQMLLKALVLRGYKHLKAEFAFSKKSSLPDIDIEGSNVGACEHVSDVG